MPGASGPVTHQITCVYTMTPDEQYIIEPHPDLPQVVYGCGYSGTSYKFSGTISEMLADLALRGSTDYDMGFLCSRRFAALSAGHQSIPALDPVRSERETETLVAEERAGKLAGDRPVPLRATR